ncbi:unnamed protein product, partial [Gadus morhua 'NCC']
DEEALRKRIREELHNGLEQERAKAEQELQAWLEAEKDAAAALAQADAQARVQQEVSRVLTEERALSRDGLHAAVLRERASADDEKLRAQRYAKHLEVREAELRKQDLFYRQQVARLEERSAQFYKVTTENYHKAADHVNGKFRRYETHPVCAELQGEILKCYQENAGKTLQCSGIAARYLECVDGSKQSIGAPKGTMCAQSSLFTLFITAQQRGGRRRAVEERRVERRRTTRRKEPARERFSTEDPALTMTSPPPSDPPPPRGAEWAASEPRHTPDPSRPPDLTGTGPRHGRQRRAGNEEPFSPTDSCPPPHSPPDSSPFTPPSPPTSVSLTVRPLA